MSGPAFVANLWRQSPAPLLSPIYGGNPGPAFVANLCGNARPRVFAISRNAQAFRAPPIRLHQRFYMAMSAPRSDDRFSPAGRLSSIIIHDELVQLLADGYDGRMRHSSVRFLRLDHSGPEALHLARC